MSEKKQRGQKRKIKTLLLGIEQINPYINTTNRYEHFHVPSGPFISSSKTSGRVKTIFCKAWLSKTAAIIEKKPKDIPFCKVVAVINTTDLWESQIIIFYDEDYYNTFWDRTSNEQTWLPIDSEFVSFVKSRNIKTTLQEKGYIELAMEENVQRKSILWFYGELSQL